MKWNVKEFQYRLVFLAVALSCFQRPLGTEGVGILGRIVISDLLTIIAALFFFSSNGKILNRTVTFALITYYFCLLLGLPFSIQPRRVAIELIGHAFIVLNFIILCSTMDNARRIRGIILAFFIGGLIASVVGLWDSIAYSRGLPLIYENQNSYTVLGASTFRNYGQTGNYALSVLILFVATILSGSAAQLPTRYRISLYGIGAGMIGLLLITGKVASIVGLATAASAMLLFHTVITKSTRGPKLLVLGLCSVFVAFLALSTFGGTEVSSRVADRFVSRVSLEETNDSFLAQNWGAAWEAIKDHPLVGTGLGAFEGTYGKYEVHSAFLKILAEAGILAFFAYLWFLFASFRNCQTKRINYQASNDYRLGKLLGVGLIGSSSTWIYTYHMDKREFWILLCIFLAITARKWNPEPLIRNESVAHG